MWPYTSRKLAGGSRRCTSFWYGSSSMCVVCSPGLERSLSSTSRPGCSFACRTSRSSRYVRSLRLSGTEGWAAKTTVYGSCFSYGAPPRKGSATSVTDAASAPTPSYTARKRSASWRELARTRSAPCRSSRPSASFS